MVVALGETLCNFIICLRGDWRLRWEMVGELDFRRISGAGRGLSCKNSQRCLLWL